MEMRLNKYLAHCGIASRRAADTLIMQGHVTVNDQVVQEMGYKVQEKDVIKFKGKPIKPVDKLVYYLLNKPRNVLSTVSDEKGRKTVIDILSRKVTERVYPVGRLDRNTSGLILLTNDGELTKKLSHPSHEVPKVYHVTLDKNLALKDMETIRSGFTLEDGEIKADSLHFMENMSKREVQIEVHSGRNRIVRRIFEHFSYEVVKLDRVYYAGLTKKNLPRGFFRPLTKEEIRMLKHFTEGKKGKGERDKEEGKAEELTGGRAEGFKGGRTEGRKGRKAEGLKGGKAEGRRGGKAERRKG